MKRALVAPILAVAAATIGSSPASAHDLNYGDVVTYTVVSDSQYDNEIGTYDSFNRPYWPSGTLLTTNHPSRFIRTFSWRVTATTAYTVISITSPGSYASCSATINGSIYSTDTQRGYRPHATCN